VKKLLLIAYYFPPDGGAGTQRPAKFCRYLPEFGWEVTVLTRAVQSRKQRGRWDPEDESLLSDVEGSARVVRVEAPSIPQTTGRWPGSVRDEARAWLDAAFERARDVVRREQTDCVLITMSPFWLSHLGRRLKEETGVPVVYDLRDPWALDGWQPQRTVWHWRREMKTMRSTLESADGVIANTPEAARRMRQTFPGLPSSLTVITNGYDAQDFEPEPARNPVRREFLLVHTGTLHGEVLYPGSRLKAALKRAVEYSPETIVPSGRTITHLLGGLRRLRQRDGAASAQLRIALVGAADAGTLRCIEESGVREAVTCVGFVSHTESVQWLLKSDALFLPLHDTAPGQRSLIVPGKTYEYLAAGRPILGCVPEGDARDLIAASRWGYVSRPTDENEIATTLSRMLADWRAGRFDQCHQESWVHAFERRQLSKLLDGFLRSIVKPYCGIEVQP
jgi:glycosyltransferase involved in cell wall biosynthesis